MPAYRCYGLNIWSDLEIPEFPSTVCEPAKADVRIRCGEVDDSCSAIEADKGFRLKVTPTRALFVWEKIGAFLISNGTDIAIDADEDAEDALVRLPLLGIVFGALLAQRGLAVLHGSAVAVGGQGVAFLGDKGLGKSTLAGAMQFAGHRLVTDDVVAISQSAAENHCSILPAFPHLKLWPDAVARLGHDPALIPRLHSKVQKTSFPVSRFQMTPIPLRRIYLLSWAEEHRMTQLTPTEALFAIAPHAYESRYMARHPGTGEHLLRVHAQLARATPIKLLNRKRSLEDLDQIVAMIEKDILERE